jgi:hypothetical protein
MMKQAIGIGLVVAGCAAPVGTRTVESAEVCVGDWGCLGNAASMGDGKIFHDSDLGPNGIGGAANSGGFKIIGIYGPENYQPAMSLQLDPGDLDELIGRTATRIRRGTALRGSRIIMRDVVDNEDYELYIDEVAAIPFWVGGGAVTSYKITVRVEGSSSERGPLCKGESGEFGEEWAGQQHSALIFRGDRYNPLTKLITIVTDTWVNVACAGTATAKLHLLRHTTASSDAAHTTTWRERQAMLRMLTADYCGKGFPYTEDGTELHYAATAHAYNPDAIDLAVPEQRDRLEAIWSHTGAVCLDKPRLVLRSDVEKDCDPPPCPPDASDWQSLGSVVSVNTH